MLGVVVLQYVLGATMFLTYPETTFHGPVGAVAVLAGSETRLPVARRIMDDGLAPVLVVSDDAPSDDRERERFCAQPRHPYRVICRRPDPFSTRGEARMVAALAERNGWRSVAVVTSRFHLLRTKRLFERCTDAVLVVRGSPEPWYRYITQIPLEWVKLAVAETTRRGC